MVLVHGQREQWKNKGTPELAPQINRNSVYRKSQITQVKTHFLINGAGATR